MGNSGGHDDRNLQDSSEMALLGKIMMLGILGLFFIIIIILFLHLYNKIYWFRRSEDSNAVTVRRRRRAPTDFAPTQNHRASANRVGLDPSTLKTIPIITYNPEDFKDGVECVVCLSELAAGDKIRLLKTCNHGFHVDCIDMWLQSHSTCPVCRNPLSTISNPINEVEQIIEINESPEIQELPTNVLFWGDETEVRNSSLSNQESGTAAIDAGAASSSGENGETKPSVIMSRLRSLKRLLSGERVNPACGSSSNEVVGEEHV